MFVNTNIKTIDCKNNKTITLCPKSMINTKIHKNGENNNNGPRLIEEDYIETIIETKGDNNKNWKDFKLSKPVEYETNNENSDSSLEWEEENDILITVTNDEESEKNDNNVVNEQETNTNENIKFEVFTPFIPTQQNKYKEFFNSLKSEDIDLNNCLVIKNKNEFFNFLDNINEKILSIIKEYFIIKIRVDPNRQKLFRRTGIAVKTDRNEEIDKEDFLNIPINIPDAKGFI